MTKSTDTNTQKSYYYCFSIDTMVHGDAWVLRYTYIACLVILSLSTAVHASTGTTRNSCRVRRNHKRDIMATRVVTLTYTKFSLKEIEQ